MSSIVFEVADVGFTPGPFKLTCTMSLSINELSSVVAAILIRLYSKTVFQTILPLTSVALTARPLEQPLTVKFIVFKLANVPVATWIDYNTLRRWYLLFCFYYGSRLYNCGYDSTVFIVRILTLLHLR